MTNLWIVTFNGLNEWLDGKTNQQQDEEEVAEAKEMCTQDELAWNQSSINFRQKVHY
jgi:hypothetical protein